MKKVWIVVLALIALSATNRGFCGDTSDAKVYGWSKDGKNVMVVRTGFMDGIGLDFREVTVLSCQNGKVLLNDYKQSDESGEKPLISEKNQTKSIIKKYKIEASKNKGIYKADKDGVVVWKSGSASYRVYLDVTSSGTTNDYLMVEGQNAKVFMMVGKETGIIGEQDCGTDSQFILGYSIDYVATYKSSYLVAVRISTPGFEGPTYRHLYYTGIIKK